MHGMASPTLSMNGVVNWSETRSSSRRMLPSSSGGSISVGIPPFGFERSGSSTTKLNSPSQVKGSTRQSDAYLSELLSYSLDRLRKEPDLLKEVACAPRSHGGHTRTSPCCCSPGETHNRERDPGDCSEQLRGLHRNLGLPGHNQRRARRGLRSPGYAAPGTPAHPPARHSTHKGACTELSKWLVGTPKLSPPPE